MAEKGYTIKGMAATAIIMLAGAGLYDVVKEAKDAYYKHKLAKCCEGLHDISEELIKRQDAKSKEVEETEEEEVQ